MEKKNLRYSINASAISRYANRNFDLCLRHLPISSGQQFFLLRIYENEGIPLNKLAQLGFFDKGTVSRGVQKLEEAGKTYENVGKELKAIYPVLTDEAGYIRVITDENDRRCRKLFVTPAAMPIIETLLNAREEWNSALTEGMTDEECLLIEKLMKQMVQNAQTYIAKKEEEITCNSNEH